MGVGEAPALESATAPNALLADANATTSAGPTKRFLMLLAPPLSTDRVACVRESNRIRSNYQMNHLSLFCALGAPSAASLGSSELAIPSEALGAGGWVATYSSSIEAQGVRQKNLHRPVCQRRQGPITFATLTAGRRLLRPRDSTIVASSSQAPCHDVAARRRTTRRGSSVPFPCGLYRKTDSMATRKILAPRVLPGTSCILFGVYAIVRSRSWSTMIREPSPAQ